MYKEASKIKLRITSLKGQLSVEQLWDLTLTELDEIAIGLEKAYKESGKKSFLVAKSVKDKIQKLRFDIVVDVLTTKVEDAQSSVKSQEKKAHNEHILGLIAAKKDEELKEMSVKDLEKQLIE